MLRRLSRLWRDVQVTHRAASATEEKVKTNNLAACKTLVCPKVATGQGVTHSVNHGSNECQTPSISVLHNKRLFSYIV